MVTPLTTIAYEMGVNRIVQAAGIPYPFGEPRRTAIEEFQVRRLVLRRALDALRTEVSGPTVFRWSES